MAYNSHFMFEALTFSGLKEIQAEEAVLHFLLRPLAPHAQNKK